MNAILLAAALFALGAQDVETSPEAKTQLYVKTVPAGATILLDGEVLGKSNRLFDVSPDAHKLSVQMEDYVTEERVINARDGEITRVNVEMKSRSGVLSYVGDAKDTAQSTAGSGHAVAFQRPAEMKSIVAVKLFGVRYGYSNAPKENFHIYLLDQDQKVLEDVAVPYGTIEQGDFRWYTIKVPAIQLPEKFFVAAWFNAEQRKGVFLGKQNSAQKTHSYAGMPDAGFQKINQPFEWMIRAVVSPKAGKKATRPTVHPYEDEEAAETESGATARTPDGEPGAAGIARRDHVVVTYAGIDKSYAEAIARVVETAHSTAAEQFGFDMPKIIKVNVTADPQATVRLFNDGRNRFYLTIRSEQDLRKPAASGIFQLYGLCHEVGHLAMYRLTHGAPAWMTSDAAEGWAHYLGSRLVDAVYAKEGADLWPDRYDYRQDGMKRLERQLAAANRDGGAAAWKQLVDIVGDQGVAPIFRAWATAKIDPANPAPGLEKALSISTKDERIAAWWQHANRVLIANREDGTNPTHPKATAESDDERAADAGDAEAMPTRTWKDVTGMFSLEAQFAGVKEGKVFLKKADGKIVPIPLDRLSKEDQDFVTGQTGKAPPAGRGPREVRELSHDNGKAAGQTSLGGSGHAVKFKVDGDSYYVTSVSLYGARYGYPKPPKENFHVWICDTDLKPVATFGFPYSSCPYGNAAWKSFRVRATRVPKEFIVCFGFNPQQHKGVGVSYDDRPSETSLTGIPGEDAPSPFAKGNWLIRCKVENRGDNGASGGTSQPSAVKPSVR